jgi:hypothetical protein
MDKSENIDQLAMSLVAAQTELKNPPFDSKNPHFKNSYASLASVRDTVTPVLAKHGLAVVQLLGANEQGPTCKTMLVHKSGQFLASVLALPVDRNNAQGYGSAYSYARRYALMAITNVVGEQDDDGNQATKLELPKSNSTNRHATVEISEEQKLKVADTFKDMKEHLPGDPEEAWLVLENSGLDSDERTYLWNFFDSKEKRLIKEAKEKMKNAV